MMFKCPNCWSEEFWYTESQTWSASIDSQGKILAIDPEEQVIESICCKKCSTDVSLNEALTAVEFR